MALSAPTTTVTLLKNLPAGLRDELGISANDDDSGDVLFLEHHDAQRLVANGYARFGSAAQESSASTLGTPHARRATATLDFPSIAAGAAASLPVNVPRAKVGQPVAVTPPVALAAGVIAGAEVTAASTVTVRVANTTGAAVDLASGAWKVAVIAR